MIEILRDHYIATLVAIVWIATAFAEAIGKRRK